MDFSKLLQGQHNQEMILLDGDEEEGEFSWSESRLGLLLEECKHKRL